MARRKQRENYGNGSVSPIMVAKLDRNGNPVIDKATGKPVKVQKKNKQGQPAWRICVTLGMEEYTDEQGRKLRRQAKAPQKTFYGTLEEARDFCAKYSAQYEHIDLSAAKMTFSKACAAWTDYMRNTNSVADRTLKDYIHQLKLMEQHIGSKLLLDVKALDIDNAITDIRATGRAGSVTVNKVFTATKRVFNFALEREWIVRNPLAVMKTPKVDNLQTRSGLSAEDAARLRAKLDEAERETMEAFSEKESRMIDWARQRAKGGDKLWNRKEVRGISRMSQLMAIRIMLASGCRRGEALALTWDAVDLDAGTIRITQSLTQKMEIKPPKSKAGIRTLTIDADTIAHLKAWKAYQASALQRVRIQNPDGTTSATKQTKDTPLVCSGSGGWMDCSNLSRWGRRFRNAHGFDGLKMHELRHTAATLLLGNGVDMKTMQTRLGHSTSRITLDFYAHAIPANDKAAADLMGKMLGAPAKAKADIIPLPDISKTA